MIEKWCRRQPRDRRGCCTHHTGGALTSRASQSAAWAQNGGGRSTFAPGKTNFINTCCGRTGCGIDNSDFTCKPRTQIKSNGIDDTGNSKDGTGVDNGNGRGAGDFCKTDYERTKAEPIEQLKSSAELLAQEGFMNVGSRETGSSSYVTVTQLEQMKPYPGVDYLGNGYDIFHGNPAGDGVYMLDPGFRQPVRNMVSLVPWPSLRADAEAADIACARSTPFRRVCLTYGVPPPAPLQQYTPKWLTRDGKFTTPVGSYSLPKYSW